MPPLDGADEPSARAPLLPPPAPRRAAARLHPLPLIVAAAFVASFHFLFLAPGPSYYQSLFLSLGSNDTAAAHLRALTQRPHVAGTRANSLTAAYVRDALSSHSFPTSLTPYSVLLSYPARRSLSLSAPDRGTIHFALEQETYPGDPYAAVSAEAVPTFLAYAASGSVAAEAVYANYGRAEDFAYLAARGVNVTGKVAVARYGKVFRGDIVRNARDAGAAAAVIYTDAKYYAAGKAFPDGPWMPPTGVQVGSTFKGVGDPTTPMWASSEGCQRLSIAEAMASDDMPGIPALPVSGVDGEAILRLIGGRCGARGLARRRRRAGLPAWPWAGSAQPNLRRVGNGREDLLLIFMIDACLLSFQGNETMATIQNVISVIEGKEEPERYVILGNHRDAWTFGGVDPNSGTAALLEIGSTEWVEENRAMITSRTVAQMLILRCTVVDFTHQQLLNLTNCLKKLVNRKVQNPDNRTESLYDLWMASNTSPLIGRLGGGGSDYSAFVQHIGIPSADMSIGSAYAVYHSLYDDFIWMEKFGDPLFQRHVAAASIWGLVALQLSDEEILPFNYSYYAAELENGAMGINERVLGVPVSLSPLHKSIKEFRRAVLKVDSELKALQTWKIWAPWRSCPLKIRDINDRLMMTERAFTEREGLSGRPWYKHLIYGPSLHNDYGAEIYPGIDDAIQTAKRIMTSESWQTVQNEIHRVARVINQAALVLTGGLT
ncbi:putative glutamate carboxypeptidase 2 [Panicum miliaceum]|uniref:Glutamate carboxypeptidase 2 n=1 Tax=Panicum miliaceum TaxID=4540 RepID=A0A3L6SQ19_PANMI|nr:putative glutamate carboxypeptidase 2 [Panicum miliaceum]